MGLGRYLVWVIPRLFAAFIVIVIAGASAGLLTEQREIAFMGDPTESSWWDIYRMDLRTGVAFALTRSTNWERYPTWSPDGQTLAYHAGMGRSFDIVLSDASGRNRTIIGQDQPMYGYQTAMVAWRPDGQQIALHNDIRGWHDIYLVDLEGNNPQQLTTEDGHDASATWSPDASQIAFMSGRNIDQSVYDIYVMNADGSNQRNLTHNDFDDWRPQWSPISDEIAFVSNRDGDTEIYIMNVDGSNQRNLTNSPGDDLDPSWLPDGSGILFSSERNGDAEIFVMRPDGSDVKQITFRPGDEAAPSWRP